MQGSRPRRHITIDAFGNPDDFRKEAATLGAANAESLYSPATGEIMTWFRSPGYLTQSGLVTAARYQQVLAHEVTHAYMDLVYGSTSPLWFAEGSAEYFGRFRWDPKRRRCEPGAILEETLQTLEISGGPLPIGEFVALPRAVMYGSEFGRLYAQAWAVCHYLYTRRPSVVAELLEDPSRIPDVGALEGAWRAHLDELWLEIPRARRPR